MKNYLELKYLAARWVEHLSLKASGHTNLLGDPYAPLGVKRIPKILGHFHPVSEICSESSMLQ